MGDAPIKYSALSGKHSVGNKNSIDARLNQNASRLTTPRVGWGWRDDRACYPTRHASVTFYRQQSVREWRNYYDRLLLSVQSVSKCLPPTPPPPPPPPLSPTNLPVRVQPLTCDGSPLLSPGTFFSLINCFTTPLKEIKRDYLKGGFIKTGDGLSPRLQCTGTINTNSLDTDLYRFTLCM